MRVFGDSVEACFIVTDVVCACRLTIALVIGFYWVVSIALVFLNKILLQKWEFAFPLSITLFQLVCTWFALALLGTLGRL